MPTFRRAATPHARTDNPSRRSHPRRRRQTLWWSPGRPSQARPACRRRSAYSRYLEANRFADRWVEAEEWCERPPWKPTASSHSTLSPYRSLYRSARRGIRGRQRIPGRLARDRARRWRTVFDAQGRAIRRQILIPTLEQLVVSKAAPEDPFSIPVGAIAALTPGPTRHRENHRVHVQGELVDGPHAELAVRDATGRRLSRHHSWHCGPRPPSRRQRIVSETTPTTLEQALVREIGSAATPEPLGSSTGLLPVLDTVAAVHALRPSKPSDVIQCISVPRSAITTRSGSPCLFRTRQKAFTCRAAKSDIPSALKSGDLVDIVGRSSPGGFAPMVVDPHIRVVGSSPLPVAPELTLDVLIAGRHDSNLVETVGVVQTITKTAQDATMSAQNAHTIISLMAGTHPFRAIVPPGIRLPANLIDARIAFEVWRDDLHLESTAGRDPVAGAGWRQRDCRAGAPVDPSGSPFDVSGVAGVHPRGWRGASHWRRRIVSLQSATRRFLFKTIQRTSR